MPKIDIALASYNGEKYISDQIASILANEIMLKDFSLGDIIISDNMSTDGTAAIVSEIARQHPNVRLLINEERGVISNFNHAIKNSAADYIMLSDQDDIWFSNKIHKTIKKLLEIEGDGDRSSPALVFTDLTVTDSKLNTISASFFQSQKIKPDGYKAAKNIFFSNVAPGCTMAFNRQLVELALPVPEQAVMHDWWLILVASTFGKVAHISDPTIFYRQHENNQVGAKKRRYRDLLFSPRVKYALAKNSLNNAAKQAASFKYRFGSIPKHSVEAIDFLVEFGAMSKLRRLAGLKTKKIENRTFFGTVILYLLALTMPTIKQTK